MLSWSGGKDSALALHALKQDRRYQVVGLLTSVNQHYGRISMHGVREALLDAQAASLGLPLYKLKLPEHSSNEEYENKMRVALETFKAQRSFRTSPSATCSWKTSGAIEKRTWRS